MPRVKTEIQRDGEETPWVSITVDGGKMTIEIPDLPNASICLASKADAEQLVNGIRFMIEEFFKH